MSLPKQLELLNGWFYTGGGSVVLEVRDETGAQYRIGLGLSHGRRTGGWRLIFRDWQIAFTSAEHIAILHLLKNESVAPSPEPPVCMQTGEMGTQNPTIIGDDLKKLFSLSAFRFPLSVLRCLHCAVEAIVITNGAWIGEFLNVEQGSRADD